MMLDQVSELSRDRAEMVSSKVHNQLMNIVDEKVLASERRAQMMEREVGVVLSWFAGNVTIPCPVMICRSSENLR